VIADEPEATISFREFLRASGALTTDDVLACVLPLFRQVEQVHQAGRVAPLDGLDSVRVDSDRHLYFDEQTARDPRLADVRLRQIERHTRTRSVDVVGQHAQTTEADAGDEQYKDLLVADSQDAVVRPVYVAGYRSWEHLIDHHDALTDMYVLGLVLASVACGLDFTDPKHVEAFAQHRRNLFVAWPQLNPVLAKQIVRLTELDRHRRAQDLASVIRALETYRDQDIELDLDLARIPGFHDSDLKGRRRILLARLRERLFEISRRNRLLYYKPTLQTLNLTFASIPVLLDVRNIRAEQIFTWQPGIERLLADGKPIPLNKYLRFEDAPYIPSVLDKVMADARRDTAEFGFSQLRLVICFLRWNNLKECRDERIDSPLLLLPIALSKRKGVRDSYVLTATSHEAEVNPVLRYHLKQLYGIDLPFSIDLSETTITAFYDVLAAQIQASEPGVTLTRVDRPQVEMVYARARRRLDQYRRRLRIGGALRTFGQFDYSYHRENYQPLGLQLFTNVIRPSAAPLHEIFHDRPVREVRMTGETAPQAEKEKTIAWFREGSSDGNPYVWEFDLCNLTLGNFNYRKMSLIRDYNMLLESERSSATFDAVFPLTPRSVEPIGSAGEAAFVNCYPVVPCDPTQLRAISAAHARRSYIVQGPPGTGKSQTITNLIADLVAQGKRILFVCEKRAAIDVVYHRLRQRGLHDLVCLIHDSQADKREFIQDLKATYERLLSGAVHSTSSAMQRRAATVEALEREQQPIAAFDTAMNAVHQDAGISTRELLLRAIELKPYAGASRVTPPSSVLPEDLPTYRTWIEHRDALERLAQALRHATADGVYARHPLHRLSPAAAKRERPSAALADDLGGTVRLLDRLDAVAREHGIGLRKEDTLADAGEWLKYAESLEPLVEHAALDLLTADSPMSQRFRESLRAVQARLDAVDKARHATRAWRRKLDPADLDRALQRARSLGGALRWLKPDYWRLRTTLREHYDFAAHAVKPTLVEILTSLLAEYDALSACEAEQRRAAQDFGLAGDFVAFAGRVEVIRNDVRRLVQRSRAIERMTKEATDSARVVKGLLAMRESLADLTRLVTSFLSSAP
jgi:hypothetical protein